MQGYILCNQVHREPNSSVNFYKPKRCSLKAFYPDFMQFSPFFLSPFIFFSLNPCLICFPGGHYPSLKPHHHSIQRNIYPWSHGSICPPLQICLGLTLCFQVSMLIPIPYNLHHKAIRVRSKCIKLRGACSRVADPDLCIEVVDPSFLMGRIWIRLHTLIRITGSG